MAKANQQTQKATVPAVVKPQGGAVVDATMAAMFAADAGAGMENATEDSFAIPFLSVLQSNSPQVDEADGKFIEGAKAGMLYENVTGQLIDGKERGALIVPCHYKRVFLRWGPRGGEGAGFKGEIAPEVVADMRQKRQIVEVDGRLYVPLPDGTVNEKRCDRIVDTRNHYVLLVNEAEGTAVQALLSLRSTQIKKSKALMSALASVRVQGPSGPYQPSMFASTVRVHTVPEKNDDGSWFGVRFTMEGRVTDPILYKQGKAFYETVKKGMVEVRYEEPMDGESAGGEQQQRRVAPSQDGNRF
jgi:hypothetical protein